MQAPRYEKTACDTSVHPSETNPHPLEVQSGAQHRLHAGVKARREQVVTALFESEEEALVKRAKKMGMCGVSPVVRIEIGRRPALCPGRCRDRLCPLCARLRGQRVRERVRAKVCKADAVRFFTFTLPADESDLGARLDRLMKAFTALRRRAAWKKHVRGGIFVFETTRGKAGGHWHVHLHVIAEGVFFPHAILAAEWSECVGERAVVDVRPIAHREKAVAYVAKYVSKGADSEGWSAEVICDYARGVHRRRLFGTFGAWHAIDVAEEREDNEPDTLPCEGATWLMLKTAIDEGTLDRETTVAALWQMGTCWRLLLREYVEGEPPLTGWPGAAVFDSMTRVLYEVQGIEHRPPRSLAAETKATAEPSGLFGRQYKV